MLYVSRMLSRDRWGIIDTDDGSEQSATVDELLHYVAVMGMDIKGVKAHLEYKRNRLYMCLDSLSIYQYQDYANPALAKMRAFKGVNVVVYEDEISSISLDTILDETPTVRLSDFGHRCSKYIFRKMEYVGNTHRVKRLIVILDDSVSITASAISDCFVRGVAFDAREVKDIKTFNYLANELSKSGYGYEFLKDNFILASPQAIDYIIGVLVINDGYDRGVVRGYKSIADVTANPKEVTRMITKQYRAEFLSLRNAHLILDWSNNSWYIHRKFPEFRDWIRNKGTYARTPDYDAYRTGMYKDTLKIMGDCTTINSNLCARYQNYLTYFEPDQKIKQSYTEFVARSVEWVLSAPDMKR